MEDDAGAGARCAVVEDDGLGVLEHASGGALTAYAAFLSGEGDV